MVPEFIKAISTLSDSGDISKPVMTSYGWHLIKLYNYSGIQPFEDVKADLSKRLQKDKRAQKSEEVIFADIKREYGYKQNGENMKAVYSILDSTIYEGNWEIPEGLNLLEIVFTLGDQLYSQKEFAIYLQQNQKIGKDEKINEYVNKVFKEYVEKECRAYEDGRLEEKYPEFKAIVKEYRDGILLFELTDKKVWSKAVNDTVGLKAYHEEHEKDFMWDTRLEAVIYTFTDTNYVDITKGLIKSGLTDEEILTQVNGDSLSVLSIDRKKFSKGDDEMIDAIKWKNGTVHMSRKDGISRYVKVHKKLSPEPKSFNEARGLITAGYQEYLEEEWIKSLKIKYPVEINNEVLSSLNK